MKEKILCPKCGEGIEKDSIECKYCGKKISNAKEIEEVISDNQSLINKLNKISTTIKFIFYLGTAIFAIIALAQGSEDESLILPNFIYAVCSFVCGLISTSFIEWMALMLETIDDIKNKISKK